MAFALLVVPVLAAAGLLALSGRMMWSVAVLVVLLMSRASDLGVAYHHWPAFGLPLTLVLAALVFYRRTVTGGSRGVGANLGFWVAVALYLAVLAASSLWAADGDAAVAQATDFARSIVLVYLLVEVFETPGSQRILVWSMLVAGTLLAFVTVLQAVTHSFSNDYLGFAQARIQTIVGKTNGYRSAGPIGDPNFYGLVLASLVPLAVYRIRDEGRLQLRAGAALCAGVLLAGVFFTYSRGALLAVAVGTVMLLILCRVRLEIVAGLVVAVAVGIMLMPTHYRERIASATSGDHAVTSRVASQEIAVQMFLDHPVVGVGADNYRFLYQPYGLRLGSADPAPEVHDFFLATLAETGLTGFCAVGGALGFTLWRSWKRRQEAARQNDRAVEGLASACFVALSTYLVGNAFIPIAYSRYLWLVVGLSLAVSSPVPREREQLVWSSAPAARRALT